MLLKFKQYFLAEASTYRQLEKNVLNFTPLTQKRQSAIDPVIIKTMKILPSLGMKTLAFFCTAKSAGKIYNTIVHFSRVVFDNVNGTIPVHYKKMEHFKMNPIEADKLMCKVRCDCPDFYYRFAYYNFKDKSIYGVKPKQYKRKTKHYPEANPEHVPGMCKHIIKTFGAIQHAGFIKSGT